MEEAADIGTQVQHQTMVTEMLAVVLREPQMELLAQLIGVLEGAVERMVLQGGLLLEQAAPALSSSK